MLIQRRPGASTISTCGSSTRSAARAAAAAARARAERRPNGERGRLGMARTERIVRRRHRGIHSTQRARIPLRSRKQWLAGRRVLRYPALPHGWTHPEGWRDWPYETPPTCPGARAPGEGGNSIRLQDDGLGDAVQGFRYLRLLRRTARAKEEKDRCRQMP